ncbi:MAG TPA: hypothetical protein VEA60_13875 [Allosphingosinicella sp.]|nr:hypothetical protein [Allosphingosinicella sp.]
MLEVLAETGNKKAAAEAVGARWSSLHWLRSKDADFDRECRAAEAAADERLAAADDAFAEGDGFHSIRRTSNGRYQLTAVPKGGWTKRHDDIFFTNLRRTGNINASARATGFDESSAWERYYKWPAFRQRWEEVLDEASLALEFRLACEGNQVAPARDGEGAGGSETSATDRTEPARFDPELALRFLKWREDKKSRGLRRGPAPKRPPIEQVAESIIRKVDAIKRHRKKREDGAA